MFARRNFVYQRQNGALGHQAIAARLSPVASSITANTVNSASAVSPSPQASSADPSSTDTALTPAASSTKTPDASSSASSAAASSSSALASASSASAASSTSASASALSSSTVHTVSSAVPTSVVAAPAATTHAPVVVSQDSSYAFTATSSLSPSPTATTHASSGPSTALIVGSVAGALAGLALLGFLLTWCLRRQRNDDEDDFDADAFKRQSAILVDDPVEPLRSYNRPQTMIENHNVSPALAAQAGYGGQNFYGNFDGYGQPAPPEMVQPPVSVPQAYGAAPMGYPAYNDPSQQQLSRQPSNAAFLARQPSAAAGYAPPPIPPASFDPGTHYIDLNRSSVSPYQAAQYADISRHLGTSNPNGTAPRESLAIPDDPLPSPFDDPVQPSGPYATSHVDVDPFRAVPVTAASAPQVYGNAAELHQRPVTVYQEGDAYGGI